MTAAPEVDGFRAVTSLTRDMARAVRSYRDLCLAIRAGGERAPFTSFDAGSGYPNRIVRPGHHRRSWRGRVIFRVSGVGAFHARAVAAPVGEGDSWRPRVTVSMSGAARGCPLELRASLAVPCG
jgi:hypothetical protein